MFSSETIDIVYFDFSKVFNTVPFASLISKLQRTGISGSFSWISNFLHNRSFSVKVDNAYSNDKPVSSGVPQGSILGPLLFIFYIHDLAEFSDTSNVKIKLYADDLKAYLIHKNEPAKLAKLQNFIDKLAIYSDKNGLKISPKKCHSLYIGGSKNKRHPYILNGHLLEPKNTVRDLGLLVSQGLKWTLI